jgi:hypothetical protein
MTLIDTYALQKVVSQYADHVGFSLHIGYILRERSNIAVHECGGGQGCPEGL